MLSLFAAIITKLRELMAPEVPRVFEAIFECTLQMITKNFAVRLAALPAQGTTMFPEAVLGSKQDSACSGSHQLAMLTSSE